MGRRRGRLDPVSDAFSQFKFELVGTSILPRTAEISLHEIRPAKPTLAAFSVLDSGLGSRVYAGTKERRRTASWQSLGTSRPLSVAASLRKAAPFGPPGRIEWVSPGDVKRILFVRRAQGGFSLWKFTSCWYFSWMKVKRVPKCANCSELGSARCGRRSGSVAFWKTSYKGASQMRAEAKRRGELTTGWMPRALRNHTSRVK